MSRPMSGPGPRGTDSAPRLKKRSRSTDFVPNVSARWLSAEVEAEARICVVCVQCQRKVQRVRTQF
eukprot:1067253-Lingulodinium_polyedra.AAC.1